MANANERGSVGDWLNHRDNRPLEAKPVLPRRGIKDPQTIIGANARPTKHVKDREGLKTQVPWLPGYRYSKEENLVIERLSEYDKADRRFLSKGITWDMADREPAKHSIPMYEDEDSLNLEGGALTDDYRDRLTLKRAWGDYLNTLPWDLFVTLTSEDPIHPESLDKLSNQIIHKLNRGIYGQNYYKIPNVGVLVAKAIEMQKRDVLHSHMLIAGVPKHFYRKDLWRFIWEKKGCVNKVEQYDSRLGAGYYLSKYVAKEANIEMYGNTSLVAHVAVPEELSGL